MRTSNIYENYIWKLCFESTEEILDDLTHREQVEKIARQSWVSVSVYPSYKKGNQQISIIHLYFLIIIP